MRIPKFVVASMVLAILALLSGSIVIVRARTESTGPALLLSAKLPKFGREYHCALPTEGTHKGDPCAFMSTSKEVPGPLFVRFRFVRREADRIQLMTKTKYIEHPDSVRIYKMDELDTAPEDVVWISPGEPVQIPVAGLGMIELHGEFLDHMPTIPSRPFEALEPQENEFRIASPLLIRDGEVVFNMKGHTATATGNSKPSVMLYAPGVGRLVLSDERFDGAIEAKVTMSQIEFNENGHTFLLVNGLPVTRSEHVWILHEPDFKPSVRMGGVSDENSLSASGSLEEMRNIGKGPAK